jgi:O-antigen/teichoic acid export membrane protein
MLKQKFIVNFGSTIIGTFLGMFAGIFVARFGGPEVLGTLATAIAYVSIFAFITGIWGTSHIKLLSEGKDEGDCMTTYTFLQLGSIFLFLIIVILYIFIQKYFFGYKFETKTLEIVVWITLFNVFVEKFSGINEASFLGKMLISKGNIISLLRQSVYHIGRIVIVVLGYKAIPLALWHLFSGIIVLPLVYMLFRSLAWGRWDPALFKRHLAIALPMLIIVIISGLIAFADKLWLQHYTSTAEVGYYTAAYSIGGLIILVGNTAGNIFFPLFSNAIVKNDWNYINDKINKYLSFAFIFILPVASFLALCSDPLLIWLLGKKFYPSVVPFSILLFASFVLIVGMPFGNIISGAGKFNLIVFLHLLKFGFFAISLYLLISPSMMGLGALGLAINLLLVNIFQNVISFFVSRNIGSIVIKQRILFILLVNIPVFILYYLSLNFLKTHLDNVWIFIISLTYFISTYSFLRLTKLFNRSDLESLFSILNVNKTMKYFKDELRK